MQHFVCDWFVEFAQDFGRVLVFKKGRDCLGEVDVPVQRPFG